jgi:hypothetical protein
MGLFKKKPDPISERAHALTGEIAALETQIKRLNSTLHHVRSQPRLRSTTLPHGQVVTPSRPPPPREPVFEEVPHHRIQSSADAESTPAHYNDLGVRKYDLPGAWQRLQNLFRPRPPANPKLVNFLAAGSVQGLRPLRYEKRVARNRFVILVGFFVLILWGIVYAFFHNH